MKIKVNGENREFAAPLNVLGLTEHLQLNPKQIAIEHNFAIVPRSLYAEVMLNEGDAIEIVHFIGGG